MGVDSGLPDFRGSDGFWRAYPRCRELGLDFASMANPRWFARDPHFAWGFYGHRLNLYRATRPHRGFEILKRWADEGERSLFVVTSNVDGQFQKARFGGGRVWEVHGAIEWAQCLDGCGAGLFPMPPGPIDLDEATLEARDPLPACPRCRGLARPNILMFGDGDWDSTRSDEQELRFLRWCQAASGSPLAVLEFGAGTAIPSIRRLCEGLARDCGGTLVRTNPREPEVPRGQVGISAGALEALEEIDARLGRG